MQVQKMLLHMNGGQRKNSFEWTMDWLQMPTETQKENNNATY